MNWIVHKILLIHGEIWSKVSNSTSLLLADVFAKVAQVVNPEVLNIKSYQSRQKHCRRSAEALFSYSYFSILFAAAKNAEIWELLLVIWENVYLQALEILCRCLSLHLNCMVDWTIWLSYFCFVLRFQQVLRISYCS